MPIFTRRSDDIRLPRPRPWILLVLALLLTACAAAPPGPPPSQTDLDAKTFIFVTSNGWHSGIVVAKADLPPDRLPETVDFPEARFLEFGWGDAVYYPAKQPTFGMSLQAALVPTPAVVHVAGLWGEPARVYPKVEVVHFRSTTKISTVSSISSTPASSVPELRAPPPRDQGSMLRAAFILQKAAFTSSIPATPGPPAFSRLRGTMSTRRGRLEPKR